MCLAQTQGIVGCVNARRTPKPPRVIVRRERFNRRLRDIFGDEPNYKLAARFGEDPSSFSLVLCGRRAPKAEFIADVLRIFGGTFDDYFVDTARELADAA